MKITFIANPRAGGGRSFSSKMECIRRFIDNHDLSARIAVTEYPGHATELASEAVAAGCTHVVVVGGDGTINETARILRGKNVTMAIVPCGSGDGLARHLGLARSFTIALSLLLPGMSRTTTIDTATANGHFFCNVMGFGLDADIAARFNQLTRRGWATYARTGLAAFFARESQYCTVVCDGYASHHDILIMSVANSDQYGNHARIAPGASVTDGKLDLIAINPVGILSALTLVLRLFCGRIDHSPQVARLAGKHFLITRERAGLIHTDGEVHETTATIEVNIQPASLHLLVPSAA